MDYGKKKATGRFNIASIDYEETESKAKVVCILERTVVKNGTEEKDKKTLFFEVPKEYGKYLVWERCDAFVVLLLHTALRDGYNITSTVPMSSDLYYNITEYLLPPFIKNGKYDISIEIETADPLPMGEGVGTGLSCGVDSLHVINYYTSYRLEQYNLTHLCINDVGAFGNHLYWKVGEKNVRKNSYERARKAAKDIGLPLIETESNVAKALRLNHILTHSFSSAFAILCMKKLWRCYYYASAGEDFLTDFTIRDWYNSKPATYEPLLLRVISTPSLRFYSAGEIESRLDKISEIADYDIARKYLYSCTWDIENCGVCKKCIRNLTSLDALGKLENFSEIYDLKHYRKHKDYHMWRVYDNKDEWFFTKIYERLMERKDPVLLEVDAIAKACEKFDDLWKLNDPESDKEAVEAIKPYLNHAKRPNFYMAKAYQAGRGVKKSQAKANECLEYCLGVYREEVASGF